MNGFIVFQLGLAAVNLAFIFRGNDYAIFPFAFTLLGAYVSWGTV